MNRYAGLYGKWIKYTFFQSKMEQNIELCQARQNIEDFAATFCGNISRRAEQNLSGPTSPGSRSRNRKFGYHFVGSTKTLRQPFKYLTVSMSEVVGHLKAVPWPQEKGIYPTTNRQFQAGDIIIFLAHWAKNHECNH